MKGFPVCYDMLHTTYLGCNKNDNLAAADVVLPCSCRMLLVSVTALPVALRMLNVRVI